MSTFWEGLQRPRLVATVILWLHMIVFSTFLEEQLIQHSQMIFIVMTWILKFGLSFYQLQTRKFHPGDCFMQPQLLATRCTFSEGQSIITSDPAICTDFSFPATRNAPCMMILESFCPIVNSAMVFKLNFWFECNLIGRFYFSSIYCWAGWSQDSRTHCYHRSPKSVFEIENFGRSRCQKYSFREDFRWVFLTRFLNWKLTIFSFFRNHWSSVCWESFAGSKIAKCTTRSFRIGVEIHLHR